MGSQASSKTRSLPVRGAWIEMHGRAQRLRKAWSLPVRGAWIEIRTFLSSEVVCSCRSPCGERGLKSFRAFPLNQLSSRSPCGERGLKWRRSDGKGRTRESLPVRGAWIEITTARNNSFGAVVAPRAGSVD